MKKREDENRKQIKFDEIERLKLENFQLRLELIEKTKNEIEYRKKQIQGNQELFAIELQKKYEIVLDDYVIDLIEGKFIKK